MAQDNISTLDYITGKYNLGKLVKKGPTEIPNVGRNNLAELFAELGFAVGAEIGVAIGIYSEILCQANPDLKLYSIDPWRYYKGYYDYKPGKTVGWFEEAKIKLEPYNCELVRKKSIEALDDFEDDSLDFVYIDGNHDFTHVAQDVAGWSKKVRLGGIVSGHDYFVPRHKYHSTHVIQVVNAYTRAYRIHPWFLLGTKAKWHTPGEIRDKCRSWMWVK